MSIEAVVTSGPIIGATLGGQPVVAGAAVVVGPPGRQGEPGPPGDGADVDLSGLATVEALADAVALIPDVSGLASKSALAAVQAEIPSITGLATDSSVDERIAAIPPVELTDYATLDAVAASIAAIPIDPYESNVPIYWGTVSGAYPPRPATLRPVIFTDADVQPGNDGSTSGGGGMVPNLDLWIG